MKNLFIFLSITVVLTSVAVAGDLTPPNANIEPELIRPASGPKPHSQDRTNMGNFGFDADANQSAAQKDVDNSLYQEFRSAPSLRPGLEEF